MARITDDEILWEDRKHWLWFPFSFTKYSLTEDRLYSQHGFFSTHYDELLLYRVTDICLTRTLGQKLCGTGTVTLTCRGDSQRVVEIRNIKDSVAVKNRMSRMIEEIREARAVVGREFYEDGEEEIPHDDFVL
ncbi:MAG: PH domain-containing protein [Clostridia bacterium]|nr:PH domain-containing protein [Clostridia bacterium]